MILEKDLCESEYVELDDCLQWSGEGCTQVLEKGRLGDRRH